MNSTVGILRTFEFAPSSRSLSLYLRHSRLGARMAQVKCVGIFTASAHIFKSLVGESDVCGGAKRRLQNFLCG